MMARDKRVEQSIAALRVEMASAPPVRACRPSARLSQAQPAHSDWTLDCIVRVAVGSRDELH